MSQIFTKTASPSQIAWEAAGLNWLPTADGALVVQLVEYGGRTLVTKRLQTCPPTRQAAIDFGNALASTHAAGATAFGVGPADWDQAEPGWIGATRLPLGRFERWGDFYAELRLLPHARAARRQGALSAHGLDLIEQVCERLRDGIFDDERPPARIHGDLWAGNLLPTPAGLVMIDPAAHCGHGLTDLAMLELFGYPQLRAIQDAYAQAAGLDADWRVLIGLHQLHPLLVHAELFGGGYGHQAVEVAGRYV